MTQLEVTIPTKEGKPKGLYFLSTVVEVIDGALVIYTADAKGFIAGFAPGQWLTFQVVQEATDDG